MQRDGHPTPSAVLFHRLLACARQMRSSVVPKAFFSPYVRTHPFRPDVHICAQGMWAETATGQICFLSIRKTNGCQERVKVEAPSTLVVSCVHGKINFPPRILLDLLGIFLVNIYKNNLSVRFSRTVEAVIEVFAAYLCVWWQGLHV